MPTKQHRIIRVPGWLTTKEAAKYLGVSDTYVRLLLCYGYLPAPAKLGTSLLHKLEDIEAYKDAHPRVGLLRAKNFAEAKRNKDKSGVKN